MERGTTATQPDRAEETDKTARVRGARGPPTCPLPRTDGSLYVRPRTGLVLVLDLACLIRVLPPFRSVQSSYTIRGCLVPKNFCPVYVILNFWTYTWSIKYS